LVALRAGAGQRGAPQGGVRPLHVLVELSKQRGRIVAHERLRLLHAVYFTSAAIRPRPATTAATQMRTLSTTFVAATATAPDRQTATVPLANAENVVNPPRNPTISKARVSFDSGPCRSPTSASAPASRHPNTFTTRVPAGNTDHSPVAGTERCATPDIQKRRSDPTAPP